MSYPRRALTLCIVGGRTVCSILIKPVLVINLCILIRWPLCTIITSLSDPESELNSSPRPQLLSPSSSESTLMTTHPESLPNLYKPSWNILNRLTNKLRLPRKDLLLSLVNGLLRNSLEALRCLIPDCRGLLVLILRSSLIFVFLLVL